MSDHKPNLLTKEELNRNLDIVDDYLCDECLREDRSGALENVKNHIEAQAELLERCGDELDVCVKYLREQHSYSTHFPGEKCHLCDLLNSIRILNAALGKGEE